MDCRERFGPSRIAFDVEASGIPFVTEPLRHLVVLGILRIGQALQHVVIAAVPPQSSGGHAFSPSRQDEPARKEMAFERMSRGWAIGSKGFRQAAAIDERNQRAIIELTQAEAREARQAQWEAVLERCMKQLRIEDGETLAAQKNAAWKVGMAAFMKVKLLASNRWLGERLGMGVPTAVSRYTGEVLRGARPAARRIYER